MKYLSQAIKELQYLKPEKIFLVKDLFKGYEWSEIPKNDRLTLGTLFLAHIKENPSLGITILGKTSAHQQQYQKQ